MKSWSSDIITLIPRAVVCLLAALPPLHALAQADANWVRSTRMLDSTGVRRAVAVDYADGLGRPFLHVDGGVGGEGQNVYTYTRHAGLAVEAERWLPVPGPQQPAPLTRAQVAALCAAEYGDTAAQAVLHTDALGRTTLAETPGAAWRRGHRGVSHEYLANGAGDVKRYRAPVDSNTLIPAGYYDAGTLRGERTVDEDSVTYTDRQGRKVLERMQRRGRKQDSEYGKTDNLHIRLGGNRPVAVEDDAAPLLYEGAIDVPSTDGTPLRLAYDARGALTGDATRGVCLVEYDLPGWPRRVQFADGSVTEFVYGASGTKLRTVHLTAVPGIAVAMGSAGSCCRRRRSPPTPPTTQGR